MSTRHLPIISIALSYGSQHGLRCSHQHASSGKRSNQPVPHFGGVYHAERHVSRTDILGDLSSPLTSTTSSSGFIAPNGPPLPLIVQCTIDQVPDLIPLAEKLQAVGNGTTVDNAEAFVKGVIEEVRHMAIWTTTQLYYGLVSSPSVKKLVAPNYK